MSSGPPTILLHLPGEDDRGKKSNQKGFLSRFLASELPMPAAQHSTKETPRWAKLSIRKSDTDKRRGEKRGTIRTVGRFFKIWGKPEEESHLCDENPHVRRVVNPSPFTDRTNIPLAPPPPIPSHYSSIPHHYPGPVIRSLRPPPPESYSKSMPDQLIVRPATADPASGAQSRNQTRPIFIRPRTLNDDGSWNWSGLSVRKSSGTCSIYSTFGNDSFHSAEAVADDDRKTTGDQRASLNTMSSQRDRSSLIWADETRASLCSKRMEVSENTLACDTGNSVLKSTPVLMKQNENYSIETISEEGSRVEEIFADKQKAIEGEMAPELVNRFSGDCFGVAGGLLLSTADISSTKGNKPHKNEEHRRSHPPPEDLVLAMLNWKRWSTGAKRIGHSAEEDKTDTDSMDQSWHEVASSEENMGTTSYKEALRNSSPSTITRVQSPDCRRSNTMNNAYTDQGEKLRNDSFSKSMETVWSHGEAVNIIQVRDPRQSLTKSATLAQENAQSLWNEDATFVAKDGIAEWLGREEQLHRDTLTYYMEHFEFDQLRLDVAFRKLCGKLYFKAEAQQIDRILEAFSTRYFDCNPETNYGSADVVHAVVYSLLLLNTDLHVAQGNYNRMTRQEFIKNTMTVIHDQCDGETLSDKVWVAEMESNLKDLYGSVKHNQVLQPLSQRLVPRNKSLGRSSSLLNNRRAVGLKRSVHSMIRKPARESTLIPEENFETASARKTTLGRSASLSSVSSNVSFRPPTRNPTLPKTQPPIGLLNRPPYLKEGVVMRKHLLEGAAQKAKHRDWKECLLVVNGGQLQMYSTNDFCADGLDRKIGRRLRAGSASLTNVVESLSRIALPNHSREDDRESGQWGSPTELLEAIPLNHTLLNALPPPGYNRLRPYVFAIQQPDGGVYLFQSQSSEQLEDWVNTCIYWAARESKEPLTGGVSNMDYGWDASLQDRENQNPSSIVLSDWNPPAPPTVTSTLTERDQLLALRKHLVALNSEINAHRAKKGQIIQRFPNMCANHAKALANWEAKSTYLLHEIFKYQNYSNALEKSILQHRHGQLLETEPQLQLRENNMNLFKEISEEFKLAF